MSLVRDGFLILGGISLSIGLLALLAGIYIRSTKTYLYFGIFSLGAGLYYLIFSGINTSAETPPYVSRLIISAAALYFCSFPFFISEFTGSRRKTYPVILSSVLLAGFLAYLLTDLQSSSLTWQVIAHLGVLGIGVYGLFRGLIHIKRYRIQGIVFILSIAIFLLLLLEEIMATYTGNQLIYRLASDFPPLDVFPVFFILLMTGVLVQDLAMKYQLQTRLTEEEKKWSSIMANIKLIITELNLDGKIEYINSHFESLTGYTQGEVIGKNWFELMIPEEDQNNLLDIHNQELKEDNWPEYRNQILTKRGGKLMINWSNLPLRDDTGLIKGVLSIGFDQTRQEEQMNEIRELKKQLEKENLMLQEEISRKSGELNIIGDSSSIKYAINKALQVAPLDSTVLLEGETGVGKELFADLLQSRSLRLHRNYLKINCAAIPRELIESELFGHKKGSFTGAVSERKGHFEIADGGTLFLDEISAMPLELQSKLLRVLQRGEFHPIGSEQSIRVNVRIIAATNENLKSLSESGEFRKDLFYRLNVYPITIPPLRQRKEDIPMLISHFSHIIGKRMNKSVGTVSRADLEKLESYRWPGNVRELENWVERAIITSQGERLEFTKEQISEANNENTDHSADVSDHSMDEIQREIILKILEECNWKINGEEGAASRLQLHPSTLRSKMKKLGISRPA